MERTQEKREYSLLDSQRLENNKCNVAVILASTIGKTNTESSGTFSIWNKTTWWRVPLGIISMLWFP